MNQAHTQAAPLSRVQESNVVQGALQHALKTADDKFKEKQAANAPSTLNKDLQAVIIRQRLEGGLIMFIVDTHIKLEDGQERIKYFEMGSNSLKEAPIALYKATLPTDGAAEDVKKFAAAYAKQFKVSNLLVRQRLVKNAFSAERQEDGTMTKEALQNWKNDFEKRATMAFSKMLQEVLASM